MAGRSKFAIMHSGGARSPSYVTPLIVVAPLVPPGRLFLPVAASNCLRHFASNALSGLRLSFVGTAFVSHAVMQVDPTAYPARPAENGVQALACPSMPYTLKPRLPFCTSPK